MNPGDLTTLANANAWLGLSGLLIKGISQDAFAGVVELAAPPPTPLSTGLVVGLYAINGPTALNGNEFPITVIDQTHFSIPVNTFALPAYTSGGYVSLSDSLMQRLISSVSAFVQQWLNRTIRNLPYVETRDGQGNGQAQIMLRNFPVTSVDQVSINGVAIPPRPAYSAVTVGSYLGGYTFTDTMLQLTGWCFIRGLSNVNISYAAGFLISNEPQTIPGTAPYVLTTLARWNAGDRGVAYASSGASLNAVTFGSALAAGQYSVDSSGVYYFSAADAGLGVLISYGYVPFDWEQATVDMIGDWFKYRNRIGILSEAIEQQTITFTNAALTARAQGVLNQYRRVAPYTP